MTYLNGTIRSDSLRSMSEQGSTAPRLSGRRAEAARNDERILTSARAVFLADPDAPIAAVAKHAGVGIGALYRRYAGKDELLQRLAADGMEAYLAEVRAALADEGDPWIAFTRFMRRCIDIGAGALTQRLAGSFSATDELNARAARSTRPRRSSSRAPRPSARCALTSRWATSRSSSSSCNRSESATGARQPAAPSLPDGRPRRPARRRRTTAPGHAAELAGDQRAL